MKKNWVWGYQDKITKDVKCPTYSSREVARNFKKELYNSYNLKVVKLVPVEEKKEEPLASIDIEKLADITQDVDGQILVDGNREVIEERKYEELRGKAVWLDGLYDWKIVIDSDGEKCLVAIEKESI